MDNNFRQNFDTPAPQPKSIFSKWWFWLIIVMLIIGISSSTALSQSGGQNSTKQSVSKQADQFIAESIDVQTQVNAAANNVVGAHAPAPTTAATASTQAGDLVFSMNETAVFENIKITATDLKRSNGGMYFEPAEGNEFIGVHFVVENISDKTQTISSWLLFDAYVDDMQTAESFTGIMAFSTSGLSIDGSVAPHKKIQGYYAVEAPKGAKELEFHVKSEWLSSVSATFKFNLK